MTLLLGCSATEKMDFDHRSDGYSPDSSVDWYSDSEIHQDLLSLPPPKGKMTISVYNFRDQSGQYLPQPANAFSTAVPQGTLPMVMSALRSTGWFELVEREGLQNLLTERKILRATKDEKGDKRPIKALSAANVIIEGGILAYDSNIRTGGGGAKYVGVGTSGQYREDQVTVGLRAVDVNSGRIFNSVSVTKRILSTQIGGSAFRFIRFRKLLEVEVGVTENDPSHVVVRDAIEAAVVELVVSGILSNHWALKNSGDEYNPLITKYSDPVKYAGWLQRQEKKREEAAAKLAKQKKMMMQQKSQGVAKGPRPQGKPVKMTKQPMRDQAGKPVMASKQPMPKGAGAMSSKDAKMMKGKPKSTMAAGGKAGNKKAIRVPVGPFSVIEVAALNNKMKASIETGKPVIQTMNLNRAKPEVASAGGVGEIYAIQLYAGPTTGSMIRFLDEYPSLTGSVWQAPVRYEADDWHVVFYGQYQTRISADRALKRLPMHLLDLAPWVRAVEAPTKISRK